MTEPESLPMLLYTDLANASDLHFIVSQSCQALHQQNLHTHVDLHGLFTTQLPPDERK